MSDENKNFMDAFGWSDKLKANFVPTVIAALLVAIVVLWLQLQKCNDALLQCKTNQAQEIERLKDAFIKHILEAEKLKLEIEKAKTKTK
jgi:sensor domain CHASE-containing protein